MAITTLIMGRSGTGKSSSVENLNANETFLISVLGKPLPFRGFNKKYIASKNECKEGNFACTDKANTICKIIKAINDNRPDIKNIILDDAHYIMSNEYFRRNDEKGFAKFSDIGANAWSILNALNGCRPDIMVFVLWHPELEDDGHYKCKTIGKSVDQKDGIEGRFLHILCTQVVDGKYLFLTNNDGVWPAKTPRDMFSRLIPNDLKYVSEKFNEYYNEINSQDVPQ